MQRKERTKTKMIKLEAMEKQKKPMRPQVTKIRTKRRQGTVQHSKKQNQNGKTKG